MKSSMECLCDRANCLDGVWKALEHDKKGDMKPPIGIWSRESNDTTIFPRGDMGLKDFILHEKKMFVEQIVSGNMPHKMKQTERYEQYRGVGARDPDDK